MAAPLAGPPPAASGHRAVRAYTSPTSPDPRGTQELTEQADWPLAEHHYHSTGIRQTGAFLAGLATAIGAGVSMALSEGLSDTGELTGRGSPHLRGAITGLGTFLGGVLHTLPFLIPHYRAAVLLALAAMAFEIAGRARSAAEAMDPDAGRQRTASVNGSDAYLVARHR